MDHSPQADSVSSMMEEMRCSSEHETDEFHAKLADFPHTFQLQDQERLSINKVTHFKSGLESALSVGYKTDLETARARNLLAFALWRLDRPDDALQQLDLVLDMDNQRNNLVTLANKAVVLWLRFQRDEAEEQVQTLLEIQGNDDDFRYLVVKAKAELAFSYTRLGPFFFGNAVSMFSKVIPEAREPEKWLWKFGLALAKRRLLRADPKSLFLSQEVPEPRDLLILYRDIAENCPSNNLKAKAFSEIALLLNMVTETPTRTDLQKTIGMTLIETCERALELDNNDLSVLCKIARIFRYVGLTEKAREIFVKVVAIRPSTTGYHHLGLTYEALATKEKNKDKVKVPGFYHNLEEEQQQPCHQSPNSNNPHDTEMLDPAVAGSNRTSDNMPANNGNEGALFSLDKEIRAKQKAIKSPPKSTTSFLRGDKFVKETLEYLQKAIDFSDGTNTGAIYDLALFYKSLNELKSSRKCLQSMISKTPCLFLIDRVKAFEQLGLVTKEMADAEKDQMIKKKLHQESESMLMQALKIASRLLPASPEGSIGEIWCSFSTLLQAVEDSDRDSCEKLRERVKLSQLIKSYKQSLNLLQEIEQIEPGKAKDPEHLKLCIEAYMATKDYEKASTFLDLLKCTSQSTRTMKLFEDEHFELKVHMQAARQTLLQGNIVGAKSYFRSMFQDSMTNASSSLAFSPGDGNASKSQTSSKDAGPGTASDGGTAGVMSADKTEHWDVVLLHEEESTQKADSLIHVLQTVCGLRVTSRHRALAPGTPELALVKEMEKCHVVAILAETDDHNDELLSHLISLAALRPSTVTLLVEGAQVPGPLKGHRSFHCPDQLLHFKDEACAELNADIIDSVFQLFAFLCHVTL